MATTKTHLWTGFAVVDMHPSDGITSPEQKMEGFRHDASEFGMQIREMKPGEEDAIYKELWEKRHIPTLQDIAGDWGFADDVLAAVGQSQLARSECVLLWTALYPPTARGPYK